MDRNLKRKVALCFEKIREFDEIIAPKIRSEIEELSKSDQILNELKICQKKIELIDGNTFLLEELEESLIAVRDL